MGDVELAIKTEIGLESWDHFYPDALPLMRAHHLELLSSTRKGKFDIDIGQAKALELAGALVIMTAREGAALAGYCLWFLSFDLECKGTLVASQGPWYVIPEKRASPLGLRLFDLSIEELRSRGVQNVMAHHWLAGGGERLGKFFSRRNGEPLEVVYSMWIGV